MSVDMHVICTSHCKGTLNPNNKNDSVGYHDQNVKDMKPTIFSLKLKIEATFPHL